MESSISPFKAGLKWSLYSSLALCIFSAGAIGSGWFDFVNSGDKEYYIFLGVCFTISLFLLSRALLYFRVRNEGLLTFGEGLSIGIFMAIFTALAVAISTFIVTSLTMPEVAQTVERTNLDEDPIRLPVALAFSVSIFTFFGFIGLSFILSLIFKKD